MSKLVKQLGTHRANVLSAYDAKNNNEPREWRELVAAVRAAMPQRVKSVLAENQPRQNQKWAWMQPDGSFR